MIYHSLQLQQFRSYADFEVEFSPDVTIIVGPNGSGKTNLLEAVYVLSQGTSFRVADKELVRRDMPFGRAEGRYGDQQRIFLFDPHVKPPKQFSIDGNKKHRLHASQRVPVVLFEPDELRLLSGSPQRRRDYMDGLLARLWPVAARQRGQFERALLQRNNILKQAAERGGQQYGDELFVWDIKFSEYASALVAHRMNLITRWNERLGDLYSAIAQSPSMVEVHYKSDLAAHPKDYMTGLLHALQGRRAHDIARGFSGAGPHRDDITVLLNGVDAAVSASRGEVRTLLLALKIIELDLLAAQSEHPPLLLLDDVFSELDAVRREALTKLTRQYQTIITTTDADIRRSFGGDSLSQINLGA